MTDDDSKFEDDDQKDYHLRHQVVDTGFSAEDDRLYDEALTFIREAIGKGRSWAWVEKNLNLSDAEIRRIVLDDFIKITLAERHFQGGENIKELAKETRIPIKRMMAARGEMISEVEEAAIKAYKMTGGKFEGPPGG